MTRFEKIKRLNVKDMASALCDWIDRIGSDCEHYPAVKMCKKGENGMMKWLLDEIDEERIDEESMDDWDWDNISQND